MKVASTVSSDQKSACREPRCSESEPQLSHTPTLSLLLLLLLLFCFFVTCYFCSSDKRAPWRGVWVLSNNRRLRTFSMPNCQLAQDRKSAGVVVSTFPLVCLFRVHYSFFVLAPNRLGMKGNLIQFVQCASFYLSMVCIAIKIVWQTYIKLIQIHVNLN